MPQRKSECHTRTTALLRTRQNHEMKLLRTEKIEFRLFLFLFRTAREWEEMQRNCTTCRPKEKKDKFNVTIVFLLVCATYNLFYEILCVHLKIALSFVPSSVHAFLALSALVRLAAMRRRWRRRQAIALLVLTRSLYLLIILLRCFQLSLVLVAVAVANVFLTDGCAFCAPRTRHKQKSGEEKSLRPICIIYASERKAVLFLVRRLHTYFSSVFHSLHMLMLQRAACFPMRPSQRQRQQQKKADYVFARTFRQYKFSISSRSIHDTEFISNLLSFRLLKCECECVCATCMSHAYHP